MVRPPKHNCPAGPSGSRSCDSVSMAGPGQYQATLELEMYGEWVLTMDISGPTRDRLIKKLQFGKMKMKPKN